MPKAAVAATYLKFLSDAEVEKIHNSALRILEEVGVQVKHAGALALYQRGGAVIGGEKDRVKIPYKMIENALSSSPSEILLSGREESNDLLLKGQFVYAGTGGAELNVIDLETKKLRKSMLADVADIARLVDALEYIDFYIRPVVAQDMPHDLLDINKYYASLANTTKHVMGNVYYPQKVAEVVEMASVITGGRQALEKRPIISFITSWMLSPLALNTEVTEILIKIAEHKMPVALSSVAILGMTSPVTMAGNLVLTHAEQLSGIVLCQLVNPGTPVIYGGCPGVADMRNMVFCPGSIERQILNAAVSQMSQYIKIPNYNLAGVTDAKLPDVQAGYEKAFGLCMAVLAGSNYIHHAAGRIKDGVAYEQYVIDNEIIGMAKRAAQGIRVDDETLALQEIMEAGPGGNFLTNPHTVRFFRQELFFPGLSDRSIREVWEKGGELDARERARLRAKEILASHAPVQISSEADKEIRAKFSILYPKA